MTSLQDRIVVVTGSTAGIGLAIAHDLVTHGARVVVNSRRGDRVAHVVAKLNASSSRHSAVGVVGDASDHTVIASLFTTARAAFGADVDAVIVNAGRGLNGSVLTSDPSQWEEMVRTNFIGAAKLMRAAAEHMIGSDRSSGGSSGGSSAAPGSPPAWLTQTPRDIVVIGSIVGRHVSPFSSMYGGTKFGIHGVAEGLRREVAPKGIRVTLVEPGFVVSEFQGVAGYTTEWFQGVLEKIGPALQPEDVARPISFLLAQPPHVHISDFIVRPTRQDYP